MLQAKCVTAAPSSGLGRSAIDSADDGRPPSAAYAVPAALTVVTCDAMLNSIRCVDRDGALSVHWLHAPAAATIIV